MPLPLQAKKRHVRCIWDHEGLNFLSWWRRDISHCAGTTLGKTPVFHANSGPSSEPLLKSFMCGSVMFGICFCAQCYFLLFSHPRIKSVLNRLIGSSSVAAPHFYIVEYGGILLCKRSSCQHYYKKISIISLLYIIIKYI